MDARVVVVDDHAAFRSVARRLLDAEGFTVVGEAADGAGAVEAVAALRPDVVLLDIGLPDTDGLAVARVLTGGVAPPAVLLVSSRSRTDYGSRIAGSGARGFIAKSDLTGDAVRRLLSGVDGSP